MSDQSEDRHHYNRMAANLYAQLPEDTRAAQIVWAIVQTWLDPEGAMCSSSKPVLRLVVDEDGAASTPRN